jgi:hypothetical protein
MPIIKRKRSIRSRFLEVLLAPLNVLAAWALLALPAVLAMGLFAAIVISMSGESMGSLWPSRVGWIEIGCGIGFVSFVAILLATRDCFIGSQEYDVWVPDTDCLDFSRRFAERLIARDFQSAFAELAPAKQASCPIEDFVADMTATWNDAGSAVAIESVSEEQLLPDPVHSFFDNCLESGERFDAITRVRLSGWGLDDPHGETACRTLALHLASNDGGYRVLHFDLAP